VLAGYCEAALALAERWEHDRAARHAAAAEQRRQWVERPVPAATAEALTELQSLLAQCDAKAVAALVRLVRSLVTPENVAAQRDPRGPPGAG
jgi:hypothetical protein